MALRFLFDEHLRGGGLWQAIGQHNNRGIDTVDVVRVGDPVNLPLGVGDLNILRWAEREGRIFVSLDRRTLPGHLVIHLAAGHHSPGIFIVRPAGTIRELIDSLVLAAHAGDPADYRDCIDYIPF